MSKSALSIGFILFSSIAWAGENSSFLATSFSLENSSDSESSSFSEGSSFEGNIPQDFLRVKVNVWYGKNGYKFYPARVHKFQGEDTLMKLFKRAVKWINNHYTTSFKQHAISEKNIIYIWKGLEKGDSSYLEKTLNQCIEILDNNPDEPYDLEFRYNYPDSPFADVSLHKEIQVAMEVKYYTIFKTNGAPTKRYQLILDYEKDGVTMVNSMQDIFVAGVKKLKESYENDPGIKSINLEKISEMEAECTIGDNPPISNSNPKAFYTPIELGGKKTDKLTFAFFQYSPPQNVDQKVKKLKFLR